ncbi:hypothetical protein [Stappia indica]|uniref:Carboxypeptidase regulatory-like domain-containing protein n=1 Tax=Stappia indica TaxID=538381 RepID=A0A285TQT8_9HYPH|nr:hypothetical protein [Stappia indica]SOC25806.1 hypothetical protein SAMN05421512_11523 [Stappia indica]
MQVFKAFAIALCAIGLAISPLQAQDVVTPPAKPDELNAAPADAAPVEAAPEEPAAPPLGDLFGGNAVPGSSTPVVPYAPAITPDTGMPNQGTESPVYMVARLSEDGPALTQGVTWRVYRPTLDDTGRLELVATATGGDADFRLAPGDYFVHTAYGYAGRTSRISVRNGLTSQTVVLNAGGIKLDAQFSGNQPIRAGRLVFDIYEREFNSRGERKIVASNVKPGDIVRLNADTYHIVSRYGAVNATVRADIRVEPGKLTEATVYHNAARVTLKLVNQPGGEAIANTNWSVLTPGGDTVVEGTGAFPAFVLASGEYQVIARNEDKLYSRDFEVKTAAHGEVEVLTSSLLKQ